MKSVIIVSTTTRLVDLKDVVPGMVIRWNHNGKARKLIKTESGALRR